MSSEMDDIDTLLEAVRFSMYKRDLEKAERQMKDIVQKGKLHWQNYENETAEYFNFDSLFELFLYDRQHKSDKERKWVHYPYAEIYRLYGELLMEMKRPQEANELLKEAIRWNPMSARIHFEYAESLRQLGRMDEYLDISMKTFDLAYTRPDLARAYRNMGYYFLSKEKYEEAIGCYIWSLQYEKDSKEAQAELYYIQIITEGEAKQPNIEEFEQMAIKEGFPLAVNKEILGVAVAYGNYFAEKGNLILAQSMYSIAYDLTHAKQFRERLNHLKDSDEFCDLNEIPKEP